MKKYDLLVFKNLDWAGIPQNENPAFKKTLFFERGQKEWYAVIICKASEWHQKTVGKDGYVVLDASVDVPDVLHLGLFWNLENAKTFAESYIRQRSILT